MKARPILFSTSMVRALLEGRKTQTRRIIEPRPFIDDNNNFRWRGSNFGSDGHKPHIQKIAEGYWKNGVLKPYNRFGVKGDVLYVRESFTTEACATDICYEADFPIIWLNEGITQHAKDYRFKPSIHMPRSESRLTLELLNIKVERLHDISEDDAIAEGIYMCQSGYYWWDPSTQKECYRSAISAFAGLWKSINGHVSWDSNPWVWVIEFKAHKCNVDEVINGQK